MRAALYHRVSTIDQNPDAAGREMCDAAARMGFTVTLDVRETGHGTNNDRPGLIQVIDAARRHRVDVVMVWKLDRFGRSAFDLLGNIRQLETFGVRFIAITQGIDIRPGSDPMSRLLLTLLSAIAEFERDLIVERTRMGMAYARRRGKHIGRPFIPKPPAEEVRRLRAQGMPWPAVAAQLGCTEWAARVAVGA